MAGRNSYGGANAQVRAEVARVRAKEAPLPPGLPKGEPLFVLPGGTPVHEVRVRTSRQKDGRDTNHTDCTYVWIGVLLDGRIHDPKGLLKTTTVEVRRLYRLNFSPVRFVQQEQSVSILGRPVPKYRPQTPNPVTIATRDDLEAAYLDNFAPLWSAIIAGAARTVAQKEEGLVEENARIAKARDEGLESYLNTLLLGQKENLEWATLASSDLAVLAKYRDTLVGVPTEDAQRAAQTTARLLDERAVMAERHEKALAAAAERKDTRNAAEAARVRFVNALHAQAHEMYAVISALQAAGLPLGKGMQARLDAIVAFVAPTVPG